jgi:hypothetical protein
VAQLSEQHAEGIVQRGVVGDLGERTISFIADGRSDRRTFEHAGQGLPRVPGRGSIGNPIGNLAKQHHRDVCTTVGGEGAPGHEAEVRTRHDYRHWSQPAATLEVADGGTEPCERRWTRPDEFDSMLEAIGH